MPGALTCKTEEALRPEPCCNIMLSTERVQLTIGHLHRPESLESEQRVKSIESFPTAGWKACSLGIG